MSVYTHISEPALTRLLERYELGMLVSYKAIEAGVENTNYFVTTTSGEWVLTLFEQHPADDVRGFVRLANHLGQAGSVPVPAPLMDSDGIWLHELIGKPAILCPRLPGEHIARPQHRHCQLIGAGLAELHLAARTLDAERANERGFDWWVAMSDTLCGQLPADDLALLHDEVNHQRQHRAAWKSLPQGWIHGDLFYDNALFAVQERELKLGAILDLYNACVDAWLFDLAIIANDWCCDASGVWLPGQVEALLKGYQSRRPLTVQEKQLWPLALRGAALRFWLSRLLTQRLQARQADAVMTCKDPNEYRLKLSLRRLQQDIIE